MNDTDYRLQLILEAQDDASKVVKDLSKEVKRLQNQVDNSSKKMNDGVNSFGSALSGIKKVLGGLAIASVFSKGISVIGEATQRLQDYEWQIERLRVLTENSTGATKAMTDELIRQAEAIDKVGVATKDGIIAAQAQFATFDMSTQAIKELIPAFTDYVIAEKGASASTEEYISMANGLAQALNGNYASLTRTGFILDEETKAIIENGTEMERVQAIVEVLNSTYEGFNQKLASTAEGMANLRLKEREDTLEAIAEKTRGLYITFDEAKTTFINMLGSLAGVTTKTNDDVLLLKDNIGELKNTIIELDNAWLNGEISAKDYLTRLKELKAQQEEQQKALEEEERWLINVEKAQKELEIATLNVKKAYEDGNITLEQATKALDEITKQQERLKSAQELGAGATQGQMDNLTRLRTIQEQVKEATKNLANAEREYASLKADKSATKSELDSMKSKVDGLKTALYQLRDAEAQVLNAIPYAPIQNNISKNLLKQYAEQWTQQHTISKPTNLGGGTGGGSGSGSSSEYSKANKEAEDYAKARAKEFIAMQKAHKEYIKQKQKEESEFYKQVDKEARESLKDQQKVLEDLAKEYKDKFDDIQDKIKDTTKEINSLTKSIEDVKKQMSDLTADENKSLAQEFITAQDELKKMEKEAEGIRQVAENTSWSELENSNGFISGFNVDYIKKYKTYLDEVNSLYEGMNDEEVSLLNEEIEHQKWYNGLNRIQQIKEDYRVRKEEAQKEYDEKMQQLEEEQEKLNGYKEEQNKLQEEYIGKIDDAWKKYDDMYQSIMQFEKDYQQQFDNDIIKQKKAIGELEDMWNRVAIARASASAYGSDIEARASGGPVNIGQTYLVGENGPELFTPNRSGTIIPNEVINNNGIEINLSGITVRSEADIDMITDEIIRKIKLEKQFGIS